MPSSSIVKRKRAVSPTRAAPTTRKDLSMIAPKPVYTNDPAGPLSDLRMLANRYPQAVHADPHELARLLRCSESDVAEAQRWMLEDGLEVRTRVFTVLVS
jgi:hypothetical protein